MENIFKLIPESYYIVFSVIIIVATLIVIKLNNNNINRYLIKILLVIEIILVINWGINNISSGKFSLQPPTCSKTITTDNFKFAIQRCDKLDKNVYFEILITNISKEQNLYIYTQGTRIFDWIGHENAATAVVIGERDKGTSSGTTFPVQIPIKARIEFNEVALEGDILSLLEIKDSQPTDKIQFNNILLSNHPKT